MAKFEELRPAFKKIAEENLVGDTFSPPPLFPHPG